MVVRRRIAGRLRAAGVSVSERQADRQWMLGESPIEGRVWLRLSFEAVAGIWRGMTPTVSRGTCRRKNVLSARGRSGRHAKPQRDRGWRERRLTEWDRPPIAWADGSRVHGRFNGKDTGSLRFRLYQSLPEGWRVRSGKPVRTVREDAPAWNGTAETWHEPELDGWFGVKVPGGAQGDRGPQGRRRSGACADGSSAALTIVIVHIALCHDPEFLKQGAQAVHGTRR